DGTRTVRMTNVVATFGAGQGDPAMLAAHWDSRPRSEEDAHPEHRQQPTPGANDGASGVAVLLEVARALHAAPPPREVRLVLFDGEDWGETLETMFYGARDYVGRHRSSLPTWGILLDMVGDRDLHLPREAFSSRQARGLTDKVYATAQRLGYGSVFENRVGPDIFDDHLPFLDAGVPFVDLIDFDYGQWHTVHDLPAECSPRSLEIVGNVVLKMVSTR
ncbi:MAG TPA: M28 family peptidase, partial [Stenomitos sp.]